MQLETFWRGEAEIMGPVHQGREAIQQPHPAADVLGAVLKPLILSGNLIPLSFISSQQLSGL